MRYLGTKRAVVALAVLGCGALLAWSRQRNGPALALPPAPPGVHYEYANRTADTWLHEGYTELVSPIRPPMSEDGRTRIAVFERMPPTATLDAVQVGSDWTLRVPDGTEVDRVEFEGNGPSDADPPASSRVLDVRGINFAGGRQLFHVLRPRSVATRELLGVSWLRGAGDETATTFLGGLVAQGVLAGPKDAAKREQASAHLRALNDCVSCHVANRGGRNSTRDVGIVNRGTDASGLFQFASIFRDTLPFETYRPRDANLGDPLIRRTCGTTAVAPTTTRCPSGEVLQGTLDVVSGMRQGDLHVKRLCASRRALARQMNGSARSVFSASISECDAASDRRRSESSDGLKQ